MKAWMFTTYVNNKRSIMQRLVLLITILTLALALLPKLDGEPTHIVMAADPPQVSLIGRFAATHYDDMTGSVPGFERYHLVDDTGQSTPLLLDEAMVQSVGGVWALNRQQVIVTGTWESQPNQGAETTALRVHSIQLDPQTNAQAEVSATDISGPHNWVTLLCKFADVSAEPQPPSFFEQMFERTTGPSMNGYWREVSYDKITSISTDVFGWYNLPKAGSSYDFPGYYNGLAIVQDCVNVATSYVNFANYNGVNVMVNSESDLGMWTYFRPPGNTLAQYFGATVMPSNKWNLALMAHEMGHGYGLPHSYGGGIEYNNPWDVMGYPSGYRCSVNADPVYGCLGQHTIAYFKDGLGWIPAERKFVAPGGQSTITLEQLALPQTNNYLMAWIPISVSDGYTVEARRRVGYDTKLAGDAVIIHKVWPADLVDIDGGATDDAGAMWTPGETFTDAANGISVRVNSATATGFVITIDSPCQQPCFTASTLTASPINPSVNEVVTFTTRLINQGPTASNVVVTMTIPNDTDYVTNSAITSQGTVTGTDPLIFTVGSVSDTPPVLSFAATVRSDVISPTILSGPVTITWDGGSLSRTHIVIANGLLIYLPMISR